jgi:hypothetical protein
MKQLTRAERFHHQTNDILYQILVHQLYVFPVFTREFCRNFVEELDHFNESNLPKGRPNTMNNYGVSFEM